MLVSTSNTEDTPYQSDTGGESEAMRLFIDGDIVRREEAKKAWRIVLESITYNMDCMEYMKPLPDKVFDLVVSDPPYFSRPERRGYYGGKVSKSAFAEIILYLHPGKCQGKNCSEKSGESLNTGSFGDATTLIVPFHPAGLFGTKSIKAAIFQTAKLQLRIALIVSGFSALCGMECCRGKVSKKGTSCRETRG